MNIYKTFEELKEELGDEYDKFMYDMNLELVKQKEKEQQELDKYKNIVDELEKWLEENTIQLYNEDNPLLLDETFTKYATERKLAYMYVLDKLNELKGE